MKHLLALGIFITSGISFVVGYLYEHPLLSHFCTPDKVTNYACSETAIAIGSSFEQLAGILFLTALIVVFANARGFKIWLGSNLVLLPLTVVCVQVLASTVVLYGPPIGYEHPLHLFGYYLYVPITFLIIVLSYLPKRGPKSGRETHVSQSEVE